jgi:hypothetical protein
VGSQGRGQLGLTFLVAALVLMPILVFSYDQPRAADATSAGILPTLATPAAPTTPPPDGPAILDIKGVGDGRPLRGSVQIYAFTQGELGGIVFHVEGDNAEFSWLAERTPYLLDPHYPSRGGWDTTYVPNGDYTLTATSVTFPEVWKSVQFIVRNR